MLLGCCRVVHSRWNLALLSFSLTRVLVPKCEQENSVLNSTLAVSRYTGLLLLSIYGEPPEHESSLQ